MNFQLLGINHRTAPVEVRERLAIPESRIPDALREILALPGVGEAMILSTCNRVEVLAQTVNGSTDLRQFFHHHFGVDAPQYERHLYSYDQHEAVRHVFRVAASLDSMIVGEPQILGQLKEAYATARAAGAVQSYLDLLLTRAFAVAKRVRTETDVGSSSVSIASAAVELAAKIFGSLEGKQVCLVGAGKMSELAARHLIARGAGPIFVANRTYERACVLASQFGGQAIRFDHLYDHCEQADIVITSTGSPIAIFHRKHGEKFLAKRKNRPMFFIDIAVPRDVDPAMNKLDGIFVYDIDDLQDVVATNVSGRRQEAQAAEKIIEAEVERFQARLQSLHVVPTIVSLQDHFETIRQAELDRVRGRLGQLSAEQEEAVEALSRGIVNKILHTPITRLKSAAADPEITTLLDTFRRIFNLQQTSKATHEDQSEDKADARSGQGS